MVCGLYPWAYAASGREPNLVYMHHTARADTEEWFTGQTRDTKSGGGGGGGGLYASGSLSTPVRNTYSMVKVTSLWGGDPSTTLCVECGTLSRSGTSCYF